MLGNTHLPKFMKDDEQLCYYPTIKYVIVYDLSELKYASGKVSGPGKTHVRNEVTLNYYTIYVGNE